MTDEQKAARRISDAAYRNRNKKLYAQAALRWYHKNKIKARRDQRDRYHKNLEFNRERARKKYWANREAIRERQRRGSEKKRAYHREYIKRRLSVDPAAKLAHYQRAAMRRVLKGTGRSAPALELLGCSPEHLKLWLTFYFQPGMTWANYGKVWHVDHTKPCAAFDLSDPAQQRECFHYMNLQPMFARENLSKGAKWPA